MVKVSRIVFVLNILILSINEKAMQQKAQQHAAVSSSSSVSVPPSPLSATLDDLFILGPLPEMEKAREDAKSSAEYKAQVAQFATYTMDKPDDFFKFLKHTLRPTPTEKYLEKLQRLCNLLYYQALFMQDFENYLYFDRYILQTINKTEDYLRTYATTRMIVINNFKLYVPQFKTSEAYNLFLFYMKYLIDLAPTDFFASVKKYLHSSNKEVSDLARYALQVYINVFHAQALKDVRAGSYINFANLKLKLLYDQLQMPYEREVSDFILSNLLYLIKCQNWVADYLDYSKSTKKKYGQKYFDEHDQEQVEKIYQPQLIKVVSLYAVMHEQYEKFYSLVRQELDKIVKEQVSKGNLGALNRMNFYFGFVKTPGWNVPRALPMNLPVFKAGHEQYQLITFERIPGKKSVKKTKKKKSKVVEQPILSAAGAAAIMPVSEKSTIVEPTITLRGEDESYILEDGITKESITIINPKQKTKEVLFKTKPNITIKSEPNYTKNVLQWFDNPDQALIDQGYSQPNSKKFTQPHRYWYPKAIHGFSRLVDKYIQEFGNQTTIPSRRVAHKTDILITIPGVINYPDKTEEMGVFAYIIDSRNREWYHRMFTPMNGQKLIIDLFEQGYFSPDMTGYYDIAFPSLPRKP